ncbi:restriction endonuclease subunit S [Campylobacter lari]|nr:restriction endonuclease subunit S [Campylobacter lari]
MDPALEKLENDFEKAGGKWKEFKLKNLFYCKRGTRLVKQHRKKGDIPLITAGELNQGVKEFINNREQEIFQRAITIDMFCNSFVHINIFCCDDNILVLTPKEFMSRYCMHFISVIINKDKKLWGYGKQYRINSFEKHSIFLPVDSNENIAFDFMEAFIKKLEEEYIRELEEEYIRELEAYLSVIKLSDYKLNEKEKLALNIVFDNGYEKTKSQNDLDLASWKKFKIRDLFFIKPTKAYKMNNKELFENKGSIPVVTNSGLNNGISGYVSLEPTENGNIITYSDTTTSEGIFYQPRSFIGYSHVQGLYPLSYIDKWNIYSLLYFVSAFKKSAYGRFDYGNKFNRNIAKELQIYLPINSNGDINFDFIETFIKAIQKEVINDVVLHNEERIQATKKIITQQQ